MKKKKIRFLVLGSNSFSGSNFINLLLKNFHFTIGLSRSKELNKVFLIKSTNAGLSTIKLQLSEQKIDVENYYNDDFQPIFEKISNHFSSQIFF